MSNEIRLKVVEAKQRDAGRGKARVDEETMHSLGIMVGDIIEIKGKKITAAIAWPAYQEDQGRKLIRTCFLGVCTPVNADFVTVDTRCVIGGGEGDLRGIRCPAVRVRYRCE